MVSFPPVSPPRPIHPTLLTHTRHMPSPSHYLIIRHMIFILYYYLLGAPGSLVDIATGYGLDGPGIELRWRRRRDFPHLSRPALGPAHPPVQSVPGLSRGKERPGRDADPSSLLVPRSRKSRAIPLLSLWAVRPVQSISACTTVHITSTPTMGRTACTDPQCLYNGALTSTPTMGRTACTDPQCLNNGVL